MSELPILRCKHNSGFYSCCMYKLWQIIQYYNKHKNIPKEIDVREQFRWYKNGDLTKNIKSMTSRQATLENRFIIK